MVKGGVGKSVVELGKGGFCMLGVRERILLFIGSED